VIQDVSLVILKLIVLILVDFLLVSNGGYIRAKFVL
jgi:hypothetical protein